MKRVLAGILTGVMVMSLAACGNTAGTGNAASAGNTAGAGDAAPNVNTAETGSTAATENTPVNETVEPAVSENIVSETGDIPMTGAYESTSPEVTDELRALVEKATSGLVGATYEPVAYVASQVVAGVNHKVLCKVTTVTAEPVSKYALVTIYEDLEGNATVTEVQDSTADAGDSGLLGGWSGKENPVVTAEAKAALEKATKELVGASYKPLALLATQVVAGTNYCLLCEITPVVPDAQPGYGIVYVYEDLQGEASITEVVDLTQEAAQ